jgi:uncharacterized protein (DUF342 family)
MGQPRITVGIGADGLSAAVRVFSGPPAGEADVYEALRAAGVVFGVQADAIARLAVQLTDELFTVDGYLVATGERAVPGSDGYFVAAFSAGIQPGHVREDGTMDFLDRELLKPVAAGAVLGHMHAASPGSAGRLVDGSEQSVAKTRECALRLGPGASLEADGKVIATRAGVLLYAPHKSLDVVQQHVHNGKVDLRSGHLDMAGSLVVRGSIERLFRVSASGDIDVQGGVEYGSVSAGGSVRVSAGVRGGETGMVSAEGDVSVRHTEYAHIVCGGLLKVESAVNSELSARDVQVTGKLRGGKTSAEHGIVAQEAGVAQGAFTALAAAVPIERPVLDAKRAIDSAKDQRHLLHKSARNDARPKGGKLGRAAASLVSAELERKVALAERREQLLPAAFIEVRGAVHPGVTIQIGNAVHTIEEPASCLRFSFDIQTRLIRSEGFVR